MGEETKIQWTDKTFNPWIGCTKVSPGCVNCYAETSTPARVMRSKGQETWGRGAARSRTSADYWKQPLKWNAEAVALADEQRPVRDFSAFGWRPHRPKVFCSSLADWLDGEVSAEWLADLLQVIHQTPMLDWQMLTKRPENWRTRLVAAAEFLASKPEINMVIAWLNGTPPVNVWVGTTMEDQTRVVERMPLLLDIPARVRFVSAEPLLGPVDLMLLMNGHSIRRRIAEDLHWVIVGGESGPDARECFTEDIYNVIDQCRDAGVPCFVKQLGAVVEPPRDLPELAKLQDKKGGDLAEWPEALQVREFPREDRL